MIIIIAGGGTGGHVFPALSLADEFKREKKDIEIIFVGTREGLEAKIAEVNKIKIEYILATKIVAGKFFKVIKNIFKLMLNFIYVNKILNKYKPNFVLGVGGYASFPTVLIAKLKGIRTAIHEQNSSPGLANKILGYFVDKIFLAFDDSISYFNKEKVICSGNPQRREILECMKKNNNRKKFTVFIVGGSQGAHSLNKAVIDTLPFLNSLMGELKFIHQTGKNDYEWVLSFYKKYSYEFEVLPFFENVWDQISKAHLILSRSGAGIWEFASLGRASILVPYPGANRHQEKNAEYFKKRDACKIIDDSELSGMRLAQTIKFYYENPLEIKRLEENIKKISKPNAGSFIVKECLRLVYDEN